MEQEFQLFYHAAALVAEANQASKEELLMQAAELAKLSEQNYFEDIDGCRVLSLISRYLKDKAEQYIEVECSFESDL